MLVEPVVGSNGIIPPPEGYLEGVWAPCEKWDILLIVDETMSGRGRTGRLFASDKFGIWVVPPLVVTDKEIGWLTDALDAALVRAEAWLR